MLLMERTLFIIAVFCPLTCGDRAAAQSYPSRPITLFTSFAPGSPQDLILRAIGDRAAKDLGQPIIAENKPGATATLAAASLLSVKPDGYTIASAVSTLVLVSQMQKVPFQPMRDFTYILQIASFPVGIAVNAASPFKSWVDVVAYAKANPSKLTYGTPGAGTNVHLGMERIARHAGISMLHVPHSGAMSIIPAVLGGHVMLMVSGTEWKPQVEAGQLRLLMIWTATRHPSFPDVPTLRESGVSFDVEVPFGLIGPKGMEPVATARLHDAFKKAGEAPDVQALIRKYDLVSRYANGEDFRAAMEAIGQGMKPVIEQLGLQRKD
jgi:tripartite-type tricarboxylate transporter receptor subunit TctC